MRIEFSATNAIDFFTAFAEQFEAEVEGNTFSLPAHIGKGNGIYIEIENSISVHHH